MKKIVSAFSALLLCFALTGCSGTVGASVRKTGSGTEASSCGMKLSFPEDWTVLSGDDIYQSLLDNNDTGYTDASELRKAYESGGTSYVLYAENADRSAQINMTALKPTEDDISAGVMSLEDYARTNHNNSLLDWQMSGYTLENAVFESSTAGNNEGWRSACDVYLDGELIMGQVEFTFEYGGCFCSLQTYYHTPGAGEQAAQIISGITA